MWNFLLDNVVNNEPERSEGPALMKVMVEGKSDLPWMKWLSWEDALLDSRPDRKDGSFRLYEYRVEEIQKKYGPNYNPYF